MTMVASYDWESDTDTHHMDRTRQRWRGAVQTVADNAKAALPDAHGRIDKAVAIVLAGDITFLDDHTARVASQSNGTTEYAVCNGSCDCADYPRAPQSWCKHKIAVALHKRATQRLQATLEQRDHRQESIPAPTTHGILQQYVVMIQGRPFVKYAGLLQLAQERGLTSLVATWTFNDADLSLAQAVATFADGRAFTECGDATPANTTRKVAVHFRRVALTRAKARCLRDALGVDLVAVEELAEE